jgi:uncharacterized membrane protein YbhN (UPF0104 family)
VKQKIKLIFDPEVLIPTLLSAALLAFLLTFANSGEVLGEIATGVASPASLIPAIFLVLVYLVAKLVQWKIYLARLQLRPGWKELLVPYAGGEIGNSLPLGVYIENYLLKGELGSGIGRSAAATTWMLITEIIICLLALLVIGVPGWPWVRPVAAGLIVGMLLVGLFFFKTQIVRKWMRGWEPRRRWLRSVRDGTRQFLEGSGELFSWHTFVYGLPLTAIYLGAYATVLYVVGNVLIAPTGHPWSWRQAAAAYAFSLVIVLLAPVLPHLGTVEASGLGVLLMYGISRNLAVGGFLALRLLATGAIIVVCTLVLLLLHRQTGAVIRRLSGKGREQKPSKPDQREHEQSHEARAG